MKTENTSPKKESVTLAQLRQIVGDNIRCYRNKLKWSQARLGQEAGLHNDYIGKVERGLSTISVDNLHKLAVIFHIDTAWLLVKDYCFKIQKIAKKIGARIGVISERY